jgi:hypothetical protein
LDITTLIIEKVSNLIDFKFDSKHIPKSISDYIDNLCYDNVNELSNDELIVNETFSAKSIEDVEIKFSGNTYKIDIKNHDVNKDLSVPNLISIDKARKYLSNINNHIIYIFIDYKIEDDTVTIINVNVKTIESLDWSYLSIQNLGKGQLQLKSTIGGFFFNDNVTRKEWMEKLIKEGKDYYDKLILKVSEYQINWGDDEKWLQ